ncbi:MAG TPA: Rod shape-determining protein MreD [Amoebophilaceae bacterium]|nr:Rod shape-determining protein MreD [Amoebophilaceae bacterium]
MSKVSKLGQLANFLLYITLQLAVSQFIVLCHTASCFIYVAFLLLLPRRQEGMPLLLLISFAVGLFVDIFYGSAGTHAFSSVLVVYSRDFLLKLMLPASGYEAAAQPTLSNLGWKRFSLFSLILIGIHHTALFFLDAGTTMLFFVIIRKVVFSTLLTYTTVLLTQSIILLIRKR